MVDYARPVEWTDGTFVTVLEVMENGAAIIRSERPGFWTKFMPDPATAVGAWAASNGTMGDSKVLLRNIEIPLITDAEGNEPDAIDIIAGGTKCVLTFGDISRTYHWPAPGRPIGGKGPKVIYHTASKARKIEEAKVEAARVEDEKFDNPMWGSF